MKKYLKTVVAMVLVLSTVVASLVPGTTAKAGDFSQYEYQKSYVLGKGRMYRIDMTKKVKDISVKKMVFKTSKKSVLQFNEMTDTSGFPYVEFYAKKIGTTKLTIKAYSWDGTVKTYKTTVKILKYKNPVKSLKMNGKQFAKTQKKKPEGCFYQTKKSNVKISITPNKGWKIKKITKLAMNMETYEEKESKLKNKSTINIKRENNVTYSIYIIMQNKKTKQLVQLACFTYSE